jgi:hypothetical protein
MQPGDLGALDAWDLFALRVEADRRAETVRAWAVRTSRFLDVAAADVVIDLRERSAGHGSVSVTS